MDSQHGPAIAIFHQYANMGSGKSIHSSIQLEAFGLEVNDKSCKVTGGRQQIVTPDGYIHPLQIKDGLAYTSMRPYTNKEWMTLPHVHWTQDKDGDPSVLDHLLGDRDEEWFDAVANIRELPNKHLFDEFGNYRRRTANMENHVTGPSHALSIAIHAREVHTQEQTTLPSAHILDTLWKTLSSEHFKPPPSLVAYLPQHTSSGNTIHRTRH